MDQVTRKILENAAAIKRNRRNLNSASELLNKENPGSKIEKLKCAILSPTKTGTILPNTQNVEIDPNTPSIKERLLLLNQNIKSVQYDPISNKEKVKSELDSIIEQRNIQFGSISTNKFKASIKELESKPVECIEPIPPQPTLTESCCSTIDETIEEELISEQDKNSDYSSITYVNTSESLSKEAKQLPKPVIHLDRIKSHEDIVPEKRTFDVNLEEPIDIKTKKIFSPEISTQIKYPSTPNTPKVFISESREAINSEESCQEEQIVQNIATSLDSDRVIPGSIENNGCTYNTVESNKIPVMSYLPFSWDNTRDIVRLSSNSDEHVSSVDQSTFGSSMSLSSNNTCLVHNSSHYQQLLKDCLENIIKTQNIMGQASQALNIAYINDKIKVSYLSEAIEAERLLLLSTQRRNALQEREAKLRDRIFPCSCSNPSIQNYYSNVTILDISVFIKREYFLTNIKENGVYYFSAIVSSGTFVFCTPAVSICNVDHDHIKFATNFKFENMLSTDMIRIQLFAYCPQISESSQHRHGSIRSKAMKFLKRDSTPKSSKTFKKMYSSSIETSHPDILRGTKFNYVGELSIQVDKSVSSKLQIENVIYDCPITGYIFLNMRSEYRNDCLARGFLTIFDRGESCSWDRYWCGLFKDNLSFWKYPIDEKTKEPITKIPLSWASSIDNVRLLPSHECPRAHSFEIAILVNDLSNVLGVSTKKYWLSADSKEERQSWMDILIIHQKKHKLNKIKR